MIKIRINNKFFRSLSKASQFLNKDKQWLSNEMRDKDAITYKDLLIEKVDEPKKVKKPKHTRKGIPVLVDGIPYKNCAEAERAIGCAPSSVSDALRRGADTVYGHKVEAVYPSMIKNKKPMKKNTNCKVLCKTTGVVYPTITEAAKFAGCDDWTMSKKMEAAGGFIDKNNNEYVRLTPMDTKNSYRNDGKSVKKPRKRMSKKTTKTNDVLLDTKGRFKGCVDLHEVDMGDFCKPVTQVKLDKKELPQVVKDAINDKIIALFKEKGLYDDIMALLEYGGFTSVKFKKEND